MKVGAPCIVKMSYACLLCLLAFGSAQAEEKKPQTISMGPVFGGGGVYVDGQWAGEVGAGFGMAHLPYGRLTGSNRSADVRMDLGYRFDPQMFSFKGKVGIGWGPVTVGPLFGALFSGNGEATLFGAELTIHILPVAWDMKHLLQIYGSWDYGFGKGGADVQSTTVGLRILWNVFEEASQKK